MPATVTKPTQSETPPVPMLQQRAQAIGGHLNEVFGQPWIQQLMGELYQRQQKSMARMQELKQGEVSSPGFWPFFNIPLPLCIDRAEGGRLWDIDGNEYLDFFMGFGAQSLHGHNPEPVVRFVREQLGKNVGNGYSHPLQKDYVSLLKELIPHCDKFAFCNSGSEANMSAVRLARAFTGRRLVIRFEGNHNGQYGLVSYNASPGFFGHPLLPFPPKAAQVPLRAFTQGDPQLTEEDLIVLSFGEPAALDFIQQRKDDIACVMCEPIPNYLPYPDKAIPFVRELGEVCKKAGVPLVLDEVHSGFRYGPSGVAGHFKLHADLVTYGKVLAGLGIPLSAVGGRHDIMEKAVGSGSLLTDLGQKTFLVTSHANNHLAIAASYASLSLLKEKGPAFYERTRQKAARLRARVEALEVAKGVKVQLNGYGEFFGNIMFMRDQPVESIRDYANAQLLISSGVLMMLLRRKGIHTHSIPLIYTGDGHSEQDIDTLADKVEESVLEMKKHQFPFIPPF